MAQSSAGRAALSMITDDYLQIRRKSSVIMELPDVGRSDPGGQAGERLGERDVAEVEVMYLAVQVVAIRLQIE